MVPFSHLMKHCPFRHSRNQPRFDIPVSDYPAYTCTLNVLISTRFLLLAELLIRESPLPRCRCNVGETLRVAKVEAIYRAVSLINCAYLETLATRKDDYEGYRYRAKRGLFEELVMTLGRSMAIR